MKQRLKQGKWYKSIPLIHIKLLIRSSIFIMNFTLVAMRVNYHSHNMSGVIFSVGHRFFILYEIMNEKIFPRNSPTFWGCLKKQCCCVLSSLQFLSPFKPTIQEMERASICVVFRTPSLSNRQRSRIASLYTRIPILIEKFALNETKCKHSVLIIEKLSTKLAFLLIK